MSRTCRPHRRGRTVRRIRRRAFTLIEFLVAMTLTIGVLAAGSLAIASSERAMTAVRETDISTRLGYELLEKIRVFGCGRSVDITTIANAEDACAKAFKSPDWTISGSDGFAGDFTLIASQDVRAAGDQTASGASGSQSFTAKVTTVWAQPTVSSNICRDASAPSGEADQPSLMRREVMITTTSSNGDQRTVTLSAVESLPNGTSYTSDSRGGALVTAPSGTKVELTKTSSTFKIVRSSGQCGGIWFPYLEPGTYSANGQQFRVDAGVVSSVNAGAGN